MRTARIIAAVTLIVLSAISLRGQLIPGSAAEDQRAPREPLVMREEWWLGGAVAGGLHQAFGTLDLVYVTSPSPDIPSAHARTDGGWGASMLLAPTIEYRPYQSPVGAILMAGVEVLRLQSTSTTPIADPPYTYNATFRSTVSMNMVGISALATWHIGTSGFVMMAGPTLDIPIDVSADVWQHEVLADSASVGDQPGFPETTIQYRPSMSADTRVGLQIGCAMNIMAGLFGYTSQLITPYATLNIATPITTAPSQWGAGAVRLGVMWRVGL